ncbi:MAG: lipid-binding SYLF domain-containing protein [Pseudomonadota bacterium]
MRVTITGTLLAIGVLMSGQALAAFTSADATELEAEASATAAEFQRETSGAETLLSSAKGVLVCPKITKAGFMFGIEGGKCVMREGGKTVDYYANRAGKFGWLAGIQWYSLILVFNEQEALDKFRTGDRDWEVGVDASVAVAKIGASGSLDTTNLKEPVVAYTFGEKGLMADLSMEGAVFKKLEVK